MTTLDINDLEAQLSGLVTKTEPLPEPVPEPVVAVVSPPTPTEWGERPDPVRRDPLALEDFVDAEALRADVSFELHDLDNAIREHAAKFVYYAAQSARARRQYERIKALTEVIDAKLYSTHREALAAEGKKATEAQVDASVKQDPRWFQTQQKLIDARAIHELAGASTEAFCQRRDMLIQVSVDRRVEATGELRVKAAQAAAGDARKSAFSAMTGISQ